MANSMRGHPFVPTRGQHRMQSYPLRAVIPMADRTQTRNARPTAPVQFRGIFNQQVGARLFQLLHDPRPMRTLHAVHINFWARKKSIGRLDIIGTGKQLGNARSRTRRQRFPNRLQSPRPPNVTGTALLQNAAPSSVSVPACDQFLAFILPQIVSQSSKYR